MQRGEIHLIKSALWQRIYAFCVFGFVGFGCLRVLLNSFTPCYLPFCENKIEVPPAFFLCGSIIGLAVCFWAWWRTERGFLRADEEGLLQHTGFRSMYVSWQKVASYRLERVRGTKERMIEPVLYDSTGKILLRPAAPVVVGMRRQNEERRQFWKFVESKLAGKQISTG